MKKRHPKTRWSPLTLILNSLMPSTVVVATLLLAGCADGRWSGPLPENTSYNFYCNCGYCTQPTPAGCAGQWALFGSGWKHRCGLHGSLWTTVYENSLRDQLQAKCDEIANEELKKKGMDPSAGGCVLTQDVYNGLPPIWPPGVTWLKPAKDNSCDIDANYVVSKSFLSTASFEPTYSVVTIGYDGDLVQLPVEGTIGYSLGDCYEGTGITECPIRVDSLQVSGLPGSSFTIKSQTFKEYFSLNHGSFSGTLVRAPGSNIGMATLVGDVGTRLLSRAEGVGNESFFMPHSVTGNDVFVLEFAFDTNTLFMYGYIPVENGHLGINMRATVPNMPPNVDAGVDQVVNCQNQDGAWVNLNGNVVDPDSEGLEFIGWYSNTNLLGTGLSATAFLPIGTHFITMLVDDGPTVRTDGTVVRVVEPCFP